MAGRGWELAAEPLVPGGPTAQVTLDAEQRSVAAHSVGPLLVLAGPGTGKTATIVESIAARLEDPRDPLAPGQVLALTFGRRAADELRDRVARRIGGGAIPLVSTFHAFAFGLVLQHALAEGAAEPPVLLSGAEDDVRVRELLIGAIADGALQWPDDLAGAVGTLALANEIRSVLARARELDIDPAQLARIGRDSGRPAWAALGVLARQEAEVAALQNALDYAELQRRALDLARQPQVRDALHRQYRAIYVDEVQDTDPTQMALLEAITGPGAALVAVGDPDQAIYAFRGADVRGMLGFSERFRTRDGAPAPVAVLGTTYRTAPRIREAALAVLGDRGVPGLPAAAIRAHRALRPVDGASEGEVGILECDSIPSRAAQIADEIRRAHVRDGIPWAGMAVLVRSARHLAGLHRALVSAGVPAVVARDEIPLREEPAVAVLLEAASVAAAPASITPRQAGDLLTGPLCGLDASMLRVLGRALRSRAREERPEIAPAPSEQLLAELLAGRIDVPAGLRDDIAGPVTGLLALLDAASARIAAGDGPGAVLWLLWNGQVRGGMSHGWPERLRAAALAGSRSAHHDIDAVTALFDAAERADTRYRGKAAVPAFIASLRQQQIPAEPVAERAPIDGGVRILTAHRAKGLEWDAVWIAGLEEGEWPDVRPRGSVLEADRLTPSGLGDPLRPAELLAEERRLLYVAITRARHRATLVALAGDDESSQPSRFLLDISRACGITPEHRSGRPRFAVTLPGLIAELRATAIDEAAHPALRSAAIERLAKVALDTDDAGMPLAPWANPATWWGIDELTPGARAVRDAEAPIAMSGSALESLLACPLRWFLEREVHADVERPATTAFGSVVHAIADHVAQGTVAAELDAADALVDRVWSDLRFEAPWQSRAERAQARSALQRFLAYHLRADRVLESTERLLEAELEVPGPDGHLHRVHLRGYIDRLERDSHDRVVPIDLKNMRNPPRAADVVEHAQLGVYQLLVREQGDIPGGAALVQLRVDASKSEPGVPQVQEQPELPAQTPTWVELELGVGAERIRSERFDASTNRGCDYCAYRTACPAQPEGQGVVT